MAPDTQTIDFDTTFNAQGLALAVPFGSSLSPPRIRTHSQRNNECRNQTC